MPETQEETMGAEREPCSCDLWPTLHWRGPNCPIPDAKGAQPEQLVDYVEAKRQAQALLDRPPRDLYAGLETRPLARDVIALATALSECREGERRVRDVCEDYDHMIPCCERDAAGELLEDIRAALAAQPPSEASERSGT